MVSVSTSTFPEPGVREMLYGAPTSLPSLIVRSQSTAGPPTSIDPAVSAPEITAPSSRVMVRNGAASSGARRASTGTTCPENTSNLSELSPEIKLWCCLRVYLPSRFVTRLSVEPTAALTLPVCMRRRG